MKNMKKVIMAVMTIIILAASATFTSCEKNEVWSDLDPKTIDPSAIWQQHDRWNQPGTIDGGLLTLTCDNHFGYQQYQGEYQSSCIYRMSGMNRPAVAEQLSGCYTVDTTNHELVAADGTRPCVSLNHVVDTIEVAELEGDPNHSNFATYLTPCHAELYQLCFDTTNHKVVGHYRDEHGNHLIAEGEWWGVQTRIVVVHDTVDRIIRDTVVINHTDTVEVHLIDTINRVIYDTVYRYEYDTINDTIIRIVERIDSIVINITRNTSYLDQHTTWDSVQVISGGCRVWGTNTVTYIVTENGVEVSRGTQPWRHYSDFAISGIAGVTFPTSVNGGVFNVNTTTGSASVGGHTITATNTGNHINGTVVVNGFNMTSFLTPCEPIAYQWSFNAPNATLAFRDVHGHPAGNYTTTYNSSTPRTETGRDTTYTHLSTTQAGVWSSSSSIMSWTCSNRRTITIYYNTAPTTQQSHSNFTITHRVRAIANGTFYTYQVGEKVPVIAGVATFTSGNMIITGLTRQYSITPMPLSDTVVVDSVEIISTGFKLIGRNLCQINFDDVWGNIPYTLNTPPAVFDGALWAMVTDSYTTNLSTSPEKWVHVIRQHGTGSTATYTWYYTQWRSGLSRADFDSVSVTASQITSLQSAITAGRALAKVYHHSDGGATFELGTVKGIQQSSGRWKVKYYDISGDFENQIEFSASTFSSYYGEDPIRGIMTASGQLTADGITMQVF